MPRTWVVVADSARAEIFNVAEDGATLRRLKELSHPLARLHERDIVADAPGRVLDREGIGRHAMSESVSPKEHEAWKLCNEVADEIETARAQGRFNRLVIVAAPAFLGGLRKRLSAPTARLVAGEINKDLSGLPPDEIRAHLPDAMLA